MVTDLKINLEKLIQKITLLRQKKIKRPTILLKKVEIHKPFLHILQTKVGHKFLSKQPSLQ